MNISLYLKTATNATVGFAFSLDESTAPVPNTNSEAYRTRYSSY